MSSQGTSQYRLDSRHSMTVSQRRDTVSDCGVRERLSKGDPLRTKHQSSVELVERRWIRQFWMRGEILRRPLHRRWHCSRLVQAAEQASVMHGRCPSVPARGDIACILTTALFFPPSCSLLRPQLCARYSPPELLGSFPTSPAPQHHRSRHCRHKA